MHLFKPQPVNFPHQGISRKHGRLKCVLLLSMSFFIFISCSAQDAENIFTSGKKWEYSCVFYSKEKKVVDSFKIVMKIQHNLTALLS